MRGQQTELDKLIECWLGIRVKNNEMLIILLWEKVQKRLQKKIAKHEEIWNKSKVYCHDNQENERLQYSSCRWYSEYVTEVVNVCTGCLEESIYIDNW